MGAGTNRKTSPDLLLEDATGVSLNPSLRLEALSLQTEPEVWSWLSLAFATQASEKEPGLAQSAPLSPSPKPRADCSLLHVLPDASRFQEV